MEEDMRKLNIAENMAEDLKTSVEGTHIISEPRRVKLGMLNIDVDNDDNMNCLISISVLL